MIQTYGISTIRKDFIASHLRSQIERLRNLLGNIEEDYETNYTINSLKEIENSLRQIRKVCAEG